MVDENPLWLPKGSVRSIIALSLVFTTCYLVVFVGDIPEALLGLVGAVIGFYFKVREG